MLRRADGDPRRERRHGLLAESAVDELARLPEPVDVDAGVDPDGCERLRRGLGGHPMDGERDRVDRAGDELCARARRLHRGRERRAGGALAVEADRKPARLAHRSDELPRGSRVERASRIVDENPGRAELAEPLGSLNEEVRLAVRPRAVDEAYRKLLAGGPHRLRSILEVREVVQRIVDPENVDAALRCAPDETPDEVA